MPLRKYWLVLSLAASALVALGLALLGRVKQAPSTPTAQDEHEAASSAIHASEVSAEEVLTGPRPPKSTLAVPQFETAIGKHGRPILAPITLPNQQKVRFLLDTGAAVTVFDESLKPSGDRSIDRFRLATPAGIVEHDVFPCPNAKLGTLDVSVIPAVAYANLESFRAAAGQEIMGVLGIDFLKRYPFEIDFDQGTLRIWESAPEDWERDEPLPLVHVQGTPYVECLLPGDRHEKFSVDTGANVSTIREEIFDALVLERELTPYGVGSAATAGGTVQNPKATLSHFRLAGFRHENWRVDRDLKNAIGLSYLSRYRVRFDLPRNRVFFRPGIRFDLPDGPATCGMALSHLDGRKVVLSVERNGAAEKAGILPDDVIETVNRQPIAPLDMFEVGQLLTSQAGVELKIGILRQERRLDVIVIPLPRGAAFQGR